MSDNSPNSNGAAVTHPDSELVRPELERLLRSDQFNKSKRCQTLLNHIVVETLAGRGDELKERLIGVNVFGRSPDYNTAEDPVVRNAAIEVRKRLAQFYVESGHEAAVRIDLHAGNYIPEFRLLGKTRPPAVREQSPQIVEPVQLVDQEAPAELEAPVAVSSQLRDSVSKPKRFAVALVVVLFLVGVAVTSFVPRFWPARHIQPGTSQSVPGDAPASAAYPALPGTAAGDLDVRLLAGDQQSGPYVDRFGNQWSPDRYFTGGEPKPGVTSFYFPPADPGLFRTVREGDFTYDIPLKPGQVYELRLYFVKPQYRYGNKAAGDGENTRLFQIRANNQVILDDFDIIKDAGFASTTVRAFKDITASADGKVHIQFIGQQQHAILSAIELIASSRGSIPPIRIHTAQSQLIDHAGNRWSSDNFYIGGQLFDSGATVTGTSDPELFNVAREGNFYYAIPLPPGRYSLTLYFAETWFHTPGQRVFDVTCNGVLLFHGIDIFQQAGFSRVLQKTFHGLEPNAQGKLLISFSPTVNYASVRALEVHEE